jgi:serine/threonine protein kinase
VVRENPEVERMPGWTDPNGRPEVPSQERPATPGPTAAGDSTGAVPLTGYTALRPLGSGRHATVLLCRHEASGTETAVKLLNIVLSDRNKRLAAHSELLSVGAAAHHPCSVSVSDVGVAQDNRPYIAQAFCQGGNAATRLGASGPFTVDETLLIGTRLALALHSAHRRGVLHLDVRPANVLFDEHGDALLSDHGLLRILQRSAPELGWVHHAAYAARELFGWEKPGPAADVYGLGATLYALLNGEPAHAEAARTSWSTLYEEVLRGELPPPAQPGVSDRLMALVRRMMSANPDGRPPLTEVHRVLRSMLPARLGSRVPALEPEPARAAPLPGWDPADDEPEDKGAADAG